jgi:hypothetical protein
MMRVNQGVRIAATVMSMDVYRKPVFFVAKGMHGEPVDF